MERMNEAAATNIELAQRNAEAAGRRRGTWTTGLFDCFKDLETLWWTFWCPTLVFARTSALFELARSLPLIVKLTVASIGVLILSIVLGPALGVLVAWIGFAAWRGIYRRKLRERLGLEGGSAEDFAVHACCMTCALSQEARQAKDLGLPPIEFCTGERIVPTSPLDPATDGPSFWAQLKAVSKCSKIVLGASAVGFLLAILSSVGAPGNVLIILLALLEPAFILYLVYWRNNRKDASLDAVIKLFAVGFYWTSQFAAMTEPVLEGLFLTLAAALGLLPDLNSETTTEDELKLWMRGHIGLVMLALLFLAFVVAGFVEELFKFLIVRFCNLGAPLRNPHTILIYLVSGAAGFSCCENLAYVFGFKSAVTGVSAFVGELYVLGLRAIMPIHVICAGFQALNYVKEVVEDRRMSVPMLLLPAILLHGTFDFILMALAMVQYCYGLSESLFNVISLLVGLLIAVVSLVVVVRLWRAQQEEFLLGFHRVAETLDVEMPDRSSQDTQDSGSSMQPVVVLPPTQPYAYPYNGPSEPSVPPPGGVTSHNPALVVGEDNGGGPAAV